MSSDTEMEFHDIVQGTLRSIERIESKISDDSRVSTTNKDLVINQMRQIALTSDKLLKELTTLHQTMRNTASSLSVHGIEIMSHRGGDPFLDWHDRGAQILAAAILEAVANDAFHDAIRNRREVESNYIAVGPVETGPGVQFHLTDFDETVVVEVDEFECMVNEYKVRLAPPLPLL